MKNPFKRTALENRVMTVAVTQLNGHNALKIEHIVKHEPRPPAPRPSRMTLVYIMPDGSEYKEYIGLIGQASWYHNMAHYVEEQIRNGSSIQLRFDFAYEDGQRW